MATKTNLSREDLIYSEIEKIARETDAPIPPYAAILVCLVDILASGEIKEELFKNTFLIACGVFNAAEAEFEKERAEAIH